MPVQDSQAECYEDLANERRRIYFGVANGQLLEPATVTDLHGTHVLYTSDALVTLITRLAWAETVTDDAKRILRYGAGRRLQMVRHAYLTLASVASPSRKKPLTEDEGADVTRDINLIYFNIVGILDNLAWAAMREKVPNHTLKPRQIGLFKKETARQPALAPLRPLLERHVAWEKSVKEKRDPVAHRIPLSIPPTVLTGDEEGQEYHRRRDKWQKHVEPLEFEAANKAWESLNNLGTFNALFWHDALQGPLPIYPTVSDDLQHLKELIFGVLNFLRPQ